MACAQLIGLSKLDEGDGEPAEAGTDAPLEAAIDAEAGPTVDGGLPATCFNSEKDPDETDVDCGGPCHKCTEGKKCASKADCFEDCVAEKCVGCGSIKIQGHADAGCIDQKEVSVADFAPFLDEVAKVKPHPDCTGFVPTPQGWSDQLKEQGLPVRFVDWCTAWAYCKWRGKHLCGTVLTRFSDGDAGQKSTWQIACEGPQGFLYPYGPAYKATSCNGADTGLGKPDLVGNLNTCRTIDAGIYDMSGNVAEWDNECTRGGGDVRQDRCIIRGGAYNSPAAALTCVATRNEERQQKLPDVGFRCCE